MDGRYFKRNQYFLRSKSWFYDLNNKVVMYKHKGRAFDIYFSHLLSPKLQIDRFAPFPKCWRG